MQNTDPRHIRTGGNPCPFADFTALREEMSKQTHPARPDIHWDRVEQLSLSLFEKNGIDLQTGAWYTLARSHLARNEGMHEGLAIICAMLCHQWAQCWPQSVHSRMQILSGLFQRLQNVFRTFIQRHEDRPLLQLIEVELVALSDILDRHGLLPVSQTGPLLQQVRGALVRLDNSPEPSLPGPVLPAELHAPQVTLTVPEATPRLLYVIQPELAPHVEVVQQTAPAAKRAPSFLGGMLTAFVLSGIAFIGGNYLTRPDAAEQQLLTTLSPLPGVTPLSDLKGLTHSKKDAMADRWLQLASGRLEELAGLSPDWQIRYGQSLVMQARALWPDRDESRRLAATWQQTFTLNGMTDESLAGWHSGMVKLQTLSDQLNALDKQRGKYLTVSELKSQVFAAMQAFNQSQPVEEQLRQMSAGSGPDRIPAALKMQTEQHLKQLIAHYSILTHAHEEPAP